MNQEKQVIHIWKGQEGTMCNLGHIPQCDGYVWLSKMGTTAAVQVNCKKCVEIYTKTLKQQPPAGEWTREARNTANNVYANNPKLWPSKACLASYIIDLCDRLDQSEADKAEMLTALEGLINYHYHNDMGVKPKEYHKAIAVIAKHQSKQTVTPEAHKE